MRSFALAASLLGLCAVAAPAAAKPWEVIVNPYFMAPYSDGKFGVGELQTNLSSSPADVFSKLNWGVMGAVEITNDDWSLVLDVSYLNIDVTNDDIRNISLNGHQAAYNVMLMKRIYPRTEIYIGSKSPISARGFTREVQRYQAKRIWTFLPVSASRACMGVLKPRHFLGVRL